MKSSLKQRNVLILVGSLLIILAIGLMIWFFMHGETTVSGNFPGKETSKTLVCKKDNVDYPFFVYDESSQKETKVDIIFSDNEVKTISLKHILHYDSENKISASEARNHAAMNKSFGQDGLGADALGISYTIGANKFAISLFINGDKLSSVTNKYFMADGLSRKSSVEDYKKHYVSNGYSCSETN